MYKALNTYLALKIPPPSSQKDQYRYAQERSTQWLTHLAQVVCIVRVGGLVAFAFGDGGVEAEELGDGYADGGEGERGAEPG